MKRIIQIIDLITIPKTLVGRGTIGGAVIGGMSGLAVGIEAISHGAY